MEFFSFIFIIKVIFLEKFSDVPKWKSAAVQVGLLTSRRTFIDYPGRPAMPSVPSTKWPQRGARENCGRSEDWACSLSDPEDDSHDSEVI